MLNKKRASVLRKPFLDTRTVFKKSQRQRAKVKKEIQ